MALKTPWHIWVVGALSLLWNAGGALDFTMSNLRVDSYMANFSEVQLSFFNSFPVWAILSWGIAVWGAALGSLFILLRNKLAEPVFLVALLALGATSLHNYVLSNVNMQDLVGAAELWFSVAIMVVAVLLPVYTRVQVRNGNLR